MIAAGYMAKFVVDRPDWLGAAGVKVAVCRIRVILNPQKFG